MYLNEYDNVNDINNVEQSGLIKLNRDLREAAATMTQTEARYLVDAYYQLQDDRIRAKNRVKAFSTDGEPHEFITQLANNMAFLEKEVSKCLLAYAKSDFVGQWSLSVCGIGGVIASGLLAHIDMEKAPSVGHIMSFAGIAPNGKKWERGQKRPFKNAANAASTSSNSEHFATRSGLDSQLSSPEWIRPLTLQDRWTTRSE